MRTDDAPGYDRFGFPERTENETLSRRRWRKAVVRTTAPQVLHELLYRIREHLGAAEAKRLFAEVLQVANRHHGSVRDHDLLAEHDSAVRRGGGAVSLKALAFEIYSTSQRAGKPIGNSADAIEKHLRRLLKERDAEDRASAEWLVGVRRPLKSTDM